MSLSLKESTPVGGVVIVTASQKIIVMSYDLKAQTHTTPAHSRTNSKSSGNLFAKFAPINSQSDQTYLLKIKFLTPGSKFH